MKKVVAVTICVLFVFSLVGCGEGRMVNSEVRRGEEEMVDLEIHYCDSCGKENSDVKEAKSGYYCYDCIINNEYEKCHECGLYYENDGFGCNEECCHNCFEDKGKICFLCSQSFGNMVSLCVEGESYFICPDCATDYFANIEPIIPVSYCIECGHLYALGGNYYEHYIFDGGSMCKECLITCGYEKCSGCDKYTDEGLTDGICGYCIEKEETDKSN